MTLKQVAEALGTTQTEISRFEVGERDPSWRWIKSIARVLGVEPGQLINETENSASLSRKERDLLDLARNGKPHIVAALYAVAEALRSDPDLAFNDSGED